MHTYENMKDGHVQNAALADDAGGPLNALAKRTRRVIICQLTKLRGRWGNSSRLAASDAAASPSGRRRVATRSSRRIDASPVVVVLVVHHAGHEQNDRGIGQILPLG